jgi:hypothetical protein
MHKSLKIFLVFILLAFFNLLYSIQAQAVNNLTGTIEIWNNRALYANRGYFFYPILVDMLDFANNLDDSKQLTEFKVMTSCGEAKFEETFDGSMSSRYGESYFSSDDCDKIVVISAQGKIDGKNIDLSKFIVISNTKAIPIEIAKTVDRNAQNEQPCEFKVLSSGTLTGQFLGIECDDYCYTAIKLENGDIMSHFIGLDPEELNVIIGTKVLINFNVEQFYPEDTGELCKKVYVIQSIEVVR